MNANPQAKRILCYGDSNVWGQIPSTFERYDSNIRWTGLLQQLLEYDYELIEEGLGGRTTIFDDANKESCNGKKYLLPCLQSHNPLDIIILLLGTNDLKEKFNQTPEQVADN